MAQKMLEVNIAASQRQNLTKATKERFHNQEKRHHLTSFYSPKEGDKDYKCNRGISPETSLEKKELKNTKKTLQKTKPASVSACSSSLCSS